LYNNFRYIIVLLLLILVIGYKNLPLNDELNDPNFRHNMILIPGGEFLMGSENIEAYANEQPVHTVIVDSFFMDQYEVTNYDFLQFIRQTGYVTTAERRIVWDDMKKNLAPNTPKPAENLLEPGSLVFENMKYQTPLNDESKWWNWVVGASWKSPEGNNSTNIDRMDHPVVHISWDDAVAFAKWAKKRLPTEAEWEWAARGMKENSIYPWGDESINKGSMKANFWQGHFPYVNTNQDGYSTTSPVGSFEPNDFGLYDMAGNVWEWCSDNYNINSYAEDLKNKNIKNPKGSKHSYDPLEPYADKKVLRGGSFLCNDSYCSGYRVSRRMSSSKDTGLNHTGFRCVKDIE